MDFRTSYNVTSAIQDASLRQYFFCVMLDRKKILLLALLPFFVAGMAFARAPSWSIILLGTMVGVVLLLWIKTYLQVIAQGRAALRIMEHPRVEISMNDELIEYQSSTGTRCHRWDKIECVVETKDFLVFMHGKLPLLSLPKEYFSENALNYIRQKFLGKAQAN